LIAAAAVCGVGDDTGGDDRISEMIDIVGVTVLFEIN
jgi:hypothetical protein